jgi:hypothetical protein
MEANIAEENDEMAPKRYGINLCSERSWKMVVVVVGGNK